MTTATILIVDDEQPIRDMLKMALEMNGFAYLEAADAREAHVAIVDHRPDLVLLDWMLPQTSGLELVRRLRRDDSTAALPVVMLTARGDEDDKILALDAGADDYIAKPFSPREMISRVNAVLRRSEFAKRSDSLRFGGLRLDPAARRIDIDGRGVALGPTEFRLLHFFMCHPERAYTRGQLLDQVWGANVHVEERTVDVHIRRLRKALGSVDAASDDYGGFIHTVRGIGYRFSPSAAT